MLLIALLWCFIPTASQSLAAEGESVHGNTLLHAAHREIPRRFQQNVGEDAVADTVSKLYESMGEVAENGGSVNSRIQLRRTALIVARDGSVDMLNILCNKGKVPINHIPADEKVKSWETPLVAAVTNDREDMALHLLSLAGSEQDLDLGRTLFEGNTLLHYAAQKGHTRVVEMLLHLGAPAHMVAEDGHTPLSVAIDNLKFFVARVILNDYRARDQLQKAFEESFYDKWENQPVPLIHYLCRRQGEGTNTELDNVAIAKFLVKQGADVAVRNRDDTSLADIPFSQQTTAPLLYLHDQLRRKEGMVEEAKNMANLSWGEQNSYVAWAVTLLFMALLLLTGTKRFGRSLFSCWENKENVAGDAARNRALEDLWALDELCTAKREKQTSKKGKKRGGGRSKALAKPAVAKSVLKQSAMMPPGTKPLQPKEEQDEVAGAAVEVKRKTHKRNNNKKPGRPHREKQDLAEAAAMPSDVVEKEEARARALQVPVREQQVLACSPPPKDGVRGATSAAAEATTIVKPEGETPTPFFPRPGQDNEEDGGNQEEDEVEETPYDKDHQEELGPDETFLLEGASSSLLCSISFKLMTSAVVAKDSHSYQKEDLERWIGRCKSQGLPLTSPLTNAPMESDMTANQALRILVGEHIEARERAWRQQLAEGKGSRVNAGQGSCTKA